LIVTVPDGWLSVHLQLVGYDGHELVVANSWRERRIPLEQIAAVERVWWYRGRLVRIRFNRPTVFGSTLYYIPKWSMFKTIFSHPEHELRRIVSSIGLAVLILSLASATGLWGQKTSSLREDPIYDRKTLRRIRTLPVTSSLPSR
jgi:hypothetical protein